MSWSKGANSAAVVTMSHPRIGQPQTSPVEAADSHVDHRSKEHGQVQIGQGAVTIIEMVSGKE